MNVVRIRGLEDGRAALAAAKARGESLTLASIPDGASSAGAQWFASLARELRAEFPGTLAEAVLDCGDSPGAALGALRSGIAAIFYDGPDRARMEDLAASTGARILAHG
ncbi:MAG: hypothetical protein HY059_01215 [Proteobacteria bacterium]|nr:hypothetical protein [Pseudomonadota bacterium]